MKCACSGCGAVFLAEPVGGHRVMCGDSTSSQHVGMLMGGAAADLCFTSPPYGQQRDYTASLDSWDALMQGVFALLPMRPGGQVLVNLGMIHRDGEWVPYWDGWIDWMRGHGWRRFGWYVWDQGPGLPGDWNGRLAPSHEWIFHFNRQAERAERARKTVKTKYGGQATHLRPDGHSTALRGKDGKVGSWSHATRRTQDKRIPDSVIRVLRRLDDYLVALSLLSDDDVSHWPESVVRVMRHKARGIEVKHPAVFPVKLPAEMLLAYSDVGDLLYEPFCGAGSTVIAAEMHGRFCYGMEIGAMYVDVIVLRWQGFAGGEAILASDGRTFAEVEAARSAPAMPVRTPRRTKEAAVATS